MTVKELCDVFSRDIDSTFEASKDEIMERLFIGATREMTEHEVYAIMIANSMRISANLAVQPMLARLVQMGLIPEEALEEIKLKPDIHLVKPPRQSVPTEDEEEKRN